MQMSYTKECFVFSFRSTGRHYKDPNKYRKNGVINIYLHSMMRNISRKCIKISN